MPRITYPAAAAIAGAVTSTAIAIAHHASLQSNLRETYAVVVAAANDAVVATNESRRELVAVRDTLPACFRSLHTEVDDFQQQAGEITMRLYLILDQPQQKLQQQSTTKLRAATFQLTEHCEKIQPLRRTIAQTVANPHDALERLYNQNFVVHQRVMTRVNWFSKAICTSAELEIVQLCYRMLWQLDTAKTCVQRWFHDDAVTEIEILQTMLQEIEDKLRELP